jgi:hypothetical protein
MVDVTTIGTSKGNITTTTNLDHKIDLANPRLISPSRGLVGPPIKERLGLQPLSSRAFKLVASACCSAKFSSLPICLYDGGLSGRSPLHAG